MENNVEVGDGNHREVVVLDRDEILEYSAAEMTDRVIQGDVLNILRKLPAQSVDLVFMDPPYFLQLPKKKLTRWNVNTSVHGVTDTWDQFDSFEDYDAFLTQILNEVKRVMKPSATVWVIATYHSLFRIGRVMQDLGFWILNDVIWLKANPMPNWLQVRFTNATETLIWAVRDKTAKGYVFNSQQARQFGVGSVGANVWVIPLCTGKERLKDAEGHRIHSTQKPAELLRRIILTASQPGDVVLDPMAGVGTSGAVARALGRRFVMVEINPVYVSAIKERLCQEVHFKDYPGSNI